MFSKIERIALKNFVSEVSKELTQTINDELQVKFQEWDTECDVQDEIIYIGKTYDKRTKDYFMDFVHELNPNCNFSYLLLSILHEIGHIETWDEDDCDNKDLIYNLLKMQWEQGLQDDKALKEYDNKYFRIPLEQNATQWGVDFAMNHQNLMNKYNWLDERFSIDNN